SFARTGTRAAPGSARPGAASPSSPRPVPALGNGAGRCRARYAAAAGAAADTTHGCGVRLLNAPVWSHQRSRDAPAGPLTHGRPGSDTDRTGVSVGSRWSSPGDRSDILMP